MASVENLRKDIRALEKKYALSYKEILVLLEKDILLPFSIFSEKLGAGESIVKYLHENRGLPIKEISIILDRAPQPLHTAYRRARNKLPQRFKEAAGVIPVPIFRDKSRTMLEHLVHFLDKEHSLSEISSILRRNYQTVWTVKNR